MKIQLNTFIIYFQTLLLFCPFISIGQNATITLEKRNIKTYSFDEPNPVPILVENPKIYPYFKFEGYSHEGQEREWEVVKLENDYISVFILPEIGGKIWGAIEKKTGEEFLYRNEVIKFRNIAMRGPWTSGGIEFNFGIIGHTPATATPVDYKILENEDGSVSCIVGAMDLPSRTHWRVEIKLEKDKAYYETNSSWYNPTPVSQSYYNWMTGAAVATDDLEFFIPGDQYLEHGGDPHSWPVDENKRKLSNYKDNNFGPHKSYHVVGEYKDFFGGYYHEKEFGFGHWSPYEEMPGQKLWLWALSRSGGVWEDLLTDSDGQYIEFQAGRLFNQYFPENGNNSITQANFDPYVMDRWKEIWFPFVDIGGMEAASKWGVLNVEFENGIVVIGLNALQKLQENMLVSINGKEAINQKISLKPMEVIMKKLPFVDGDIIEVNVGRKKIYYSNDSERMKLKRPFYSDARDSLTNNQNLHFEAWEAMKFRDFGKARKELNILLKKEPYHQDALVKMAELEYRRSNYDQALIFANRALELDTYDPGANYQAGISYRAKKDYVNAIESFGWAARSMTFRSVSYAQIAESYLILEEIENAIDMANKSLDFNKYNINARMVLTVCFRKLGMEREHLEQLEEILRIDPLNHFASFERNKSVKITNEFPAETLLELALQYYSLGLNLDAFAALNSGGNSVKNSLWQAYLNQDSEDGKSKQQLELVLQKDIDFTFPYRRESIEVLEWARGQLDNWKLDYYLALNYYAVGKNKLADQLIEACQNNPDSDVFYRFRGQMLKSAALDTRIADYSKAYEINKDDWKQLTEHIQLYLEAGEIDNANKLAVETHQKFPNNYNTGLIYAKSLLVSQEYEKTINILNGIKVLPSELARESRNTYYKAHVLYADQLIMNNELDKAIQVIESSKSWPENLGVGRPYVVDERLQDYLLGICYEKLEMSDKSIASFNKVIQFSDNEQEASKMNYVLKLLALQKLGKTKTLKNLISKLEKSSLIEDKLALGMFDSSETDKKDDMIDLMRRIVKY